MKSVHDATRSRLDRRSALRLLPPCAAEGETVHYASRLRAALRFTSWRPADHLAGHPPRQGVLEELTPSHSGARSEPGNHNHDRSLVRQIRAAYRVCLPLWRHAAQLLLPGVIDSGLASRPGMTGSGFLCRQPWWARRTANSCPASPGETSKSLSTPSRKNILLYRISEFRYREPSRPMRGDSRIVTKRGAGCGGRGQRWRESDMQGGFRVEPETRECVTIANAVKRSRVAPMARTRMPVESPEDARGSEIRWSWRTDFRL